MIPGMPPPLRQSRMPERHDPCPGPAAVVKLRQNPPPLLAIRCPPAPVGNQFDRAVAAEFQRTPPVSGVVDDVDRRQILPAVSGYADQLCQRAYHKEAMRLSCAYETSTAAKISDLTAERVEHVFLHIPVLNQSTESPDVFVPTSRFCSFGSTMEQQGQRVRKGAEHHLLRKVSDA